MKKWRFVEGVVVLGIEGGGGWEDSKGRMVKKRYPG